MIIRIIAVVLISHLSISAFAQQEETVFKVYGNCTMCKKRIEDAVRALPGVVSFEWGVKTKKAKLSIDNQRITSDKVQKNIASTGHDTEDFKARDAKYHLLPSCCQYERNTKFNPAKK